MYFLLYAVLQILLAKLQIFDKVQNLRTNPFT